MGFGRYVFSTNVNRTFFSIDQICRLVFLEPLGVQRHTVPHFKGLINAKVDLEAQERGSTITIRHAHLNKAILYREMAKGAAIFSSHCILVITAVGSLGPENQSQLV